MVRPRWVLLRSGGVVVSRAEAEAYVREFGRTSPETCEMYVEVFEALFGREPDSEDADSEQGVWGLCWAEVSS